LLGFLFLPSTTIAYAIAQNERGGLNGTGLSIPRVETRSFIE